MMELFL